MSEKVRWLKTGGGSLRLKTGKIIKPNEKFSACPEEIPEAFRDIVVPIGDLPKEVPIVSETEFKIEDREVEATEVEEVPGGAAVGTEDMVEHEGEPTHKIKDRGRGWYDVVNVATGKPINDSGLREDAAKELLESLS